MHIYFNSIENNKIASHDITGRVQTQKKFIKDTGKEKLILLSGYITLSDKTEKYFKRGWYNKDLELLQR